MTDFGASRLTLLLLASAAGSLISTIKGGFGGPVSDEAARSYFARIVAAAQANDFDTLCRLSASVGTCEAELHTYCPENVPAGPSGPVFPSGEELERLCRESVPTEPPKIVSSTHRPGRDGYVGGRLLLVKGTDGRGDPYETEVLIFRDKRSYKATHAVFWSGSKFPADRTSAKPEPPG